LKRNISGELPIRLLLQEQHIVQRKIYDIASLVLNSIRQFIAAPALVSSPAPFYSPQTRRNFIEKIMVAEQVFVNCYNCNPIT
jgi:hypothetical protein